MCLNIIFYLIGERKNSLSVTKHLLIFLWYVSEPNIAYRHVGKRFKLALSTVQSILLKVSKFLCDREENAIKWPNEEERKASSNHFNTTTTLSGIVGVIGHSYIEVNFPEENKSEENILIQGVCNEKLKFTHIYINTGSKKDILKNSKLVEKLESLDQGQFLVGDVEYADSPYILIPLKSNFDVGEDQKQRNENIKTALKQFDISVDRVKEKFKRLRYFKIRNEKLRLMMLKACFVLYNLNCNFEPCGT